MANDDIRGLERDLAEALRQQQSLQEAVEMLRHTGGDGSELARALGELTQEITRLQEALYATSSGREIQEADNSTSATPWSRSKLLAWLALLTALAAWYFYPSSSSAPRSPPAERNAVKKESDRVERGSLPAAPPVVGGIEASTAEERAQRDAAPRGITTARLAEIEGFMDSVRALTDAGAVRPPGTTDLRGTPGPAMEVAEFIVQLYNSNTARGVGVDQQVLTQLIKSVIKRNGDAVLAILLRSPDVEHDLILVVDSIVNPLSDPFVPADSVIDKEAAAKKLDYVFRDGVPRNLDLLYADIAMVLSPEEARALAKSTGDPLVRRALTKLGDSSARRYVRRPRGALEAESLEVAEKEPAQPSAAQRLAAVLAEGTTRDGDLLYLKLRRVISPEEAGVLLSSTQDHLVRRVLGVIAREAPVIDGDSAPKAADPREPEKHGKVGAEYHNDRFLDDLVEKLKALDDVPAKSKKGGQ